MAPAASALVPPALLTREELTPALWDELLPLLASHYDEICAWKELAKLKPRTERYAALQEAGHLRVWTARAEGRLVGYLSVVVDYHLHYADLLAAHQDVLYVTRDYRGQRVGDQLLAHAEQALRADGVQVFIQHSKSDPRTSIVPWLRRKGYQLLDAILFKRLA